MKAKPKKERPASAKRGPVKYIIATEQESTKSVPAASVKSDPPASVTNVLVVVIVVGKEAADTSRHVCRLVLTRPDLRRMSANGGSADA